MTAAVVGLRSRSGLCSLCQMPLWDPGPIPRPQQVDNVPRDLGGLLFGRPAAEGDACEPGRSLLAGSLTVFAELPRRAVLSFVDRSALLLLASCLALAAGIEVAPAEEVQQRVLMLYSQNALTPATVTAGEAAKRRLTSQTRVRLDVYSEFLDFARFAGADHEARTARHLAEKYSDRKPTLILALGPQSLQFAIRNRTSPVFEAPIVFCCTSRARLDGLVACCSPRYRHHQRV